jgi:LysM repeat protein
MFGKILLIAALALIAWATLARASQGAGPEQRYTVRPGDTLWTIAVKHYAGDPRDAIYRIDRRNHLGGSVLVPGERLVLPSAR